MCAQNLWNKLCIERSQTFSPDKQMEILINHYLELNIYFVLSADESTELLIKKLKFVSGTIQTVHSLYSDFIAAHSKRLAEKIDIKNAFICFQK